MGGERTVQSLLTSPEIVGKLVLLSVVSAAPVVGRGWVVRWMARRSGGEGQGSERDGDVERDTEDVGKEMDDVRGEDRQGEGRGRWAWVRQWRERSRRERNERWRREVEVLVREKEGLPM